MTTPTQGEHAQPEALRLADALASNYFDGKQGRDVWDAAAAELRRLHAQVAALTAAPQGGAYAELPDPSPDQLRAIAREARNNSGSASDDCGAGTYVLHGWRAAAGALRASHGQAPAGAAVGVPRDELPECVIQLQEMWDTLEKKGKATTNDLIRWSNALSSVEQALAQPAALPDGWVPLVITHEGQYPEEIAYGPQRMMDRLGKWLHKYFDSVAAPTAQPAPAATPQADSQSVGLTVDDAIKIAQSIGVHEYGPNSRNWSFEYSQLAQFVALLTAAAYVDADRAARAPADSVLEDAALWTTETEHAIRQGHEIAASDGYFEARPQIDSNDRRKVFQAGFERGWDAARKQKANHD